YLLLFWHASRHQQSRRLHALSCDRGSAAARARALQHLLCALPLALGGRQWLRANAWICPAASLVSYRSPAKSALGIFLRRDDSRLRDDAGLRFPYSA